MEIFTPPPTIDTTEGTDSPVGDFSRPLGSESRLHPCHDCKTLGNWPLLMNTTVVGDMQYLCADCREENDPDGVMQTPCPHCHGSGREWEGWDCEYCGGLGTDDF